MVYFINGIWNSKYKVIMSLAMMSSYEFILIYGSGWWVINETSSKITAVFVGIFGIAIMTTVCIMHESLLTELCI